MDTPEFSPETTKRRNRRVKQGNFIVRSVQDFVKFVKKLNKATEGLLFIAGGFLMKKGWDYLYKLYEDRYKSRNLITDMDKYMKKFDDEPDDAKRSIYRQKLTAHNAVYFALMNKDYVTDPKYLLEPKKEVGGGGILRRPRKVVFDSDILTDEVDDVINIAKDSKIARAAIDRIVGKKERKGVSFEGAFGRRRRRRSRSRRHKRRRSRSPRRSLRRSSRRSVRKSRSRRRRRSRR